LIARTPVVDSLSVVLGHNFERNKSSLVFDCTKVGLLERNVWYKID